jgi:hypothetical protein
MASGRRGRLQLPLIPTGAKTDRRCGNSRLQVPPRLGVRDASVHFRVLGEQARAGDVPLWQPPSLKCRSPAAEKRISQHDRQAGPRGSTRVQPADDDAPSRGEERTTNSSSPRCAYRNVRFGNSLLHRDSPAAA